MKTMVEISAEIASVQARHHQLTLDEISDGLRKVFQTLQELHQDTHGGPDAGLQDTFSGHPELSIQRHHVVCLECGNTFKLLSNRHLALHDLTPTEYKRKYGIRLTQPLSAHALSAKRCKVAKERGIGKNLAAWRAARKRLSEQKAS